MRATVLFLLPLVLACKGGEESYTQALDPGYVRLSKTTSVYYRCPEWQFEELSIYLSCLRTDDAGDEQLLVIDLAQEGGGFDGVLNYEQSDIGGSINISGGEAAGCIGGCGSGATGDSQASSCEVGVDGEPLGIIRCGESLETGDQEDAEDEEGSPAHSGDGFIIDWGMAVQMYPGVHDEILESLQ